MGLFSHKQAEPVRGTAHVMTVSPQHREAGGGKVRLHLMIRIPDKTPYRARHEDFAQESKWPFQGQLLPVMVDPKHTDRVEIIWDEVPESDPRAAAPSLAEALKTALAARAGLGTEQAATLLDLRGNTEALAQLTPMLQRIEQVTGRDLAGSIEQALDLATSVASGAVTAQAPEAVLQQTLTAATRIARKRAKAQARAETHTKESRASRFSPIAPMPPVTPWQDTERFVVPVLPPMAARAPQRTLSART